MESATATGRLDWHSESLVAVKRCQTAKGSAPMTVPQTRSLLLNKSGQIPQVSKLLLDSEVSAENST